MKRNSTLFTLLVPALGAASFAARWLLFRTAVDERGLLIPWHPLTVLILVLTVLAALLSLKAVSGEVPDIAPSRASALGCAVLALSLAAAALSASPANVLDLVWKVLGLGAAAALCFAAWNDTQGKQPSFLCSAILCLFFISHLILRYRPWSSNPQWMEYLHELFSTGCLLLHAYYQAANGADMKNAKMLRLTALFGGFCCLTAAAWGNLPLLYLAGGLWMLLPVFRWEGEAL